MATITFIAGGGAKNWSDGTAWDLGRAPLASDDVIFNTTSGTDNLTVDGTSGSPSVCRSFDATSCTKTLTMGATAYLKVGDGTAGIFKLVAGMTFIPNAASTIEFVSTTGTNNITSASKTLGQVIFNGAGGTWQLQDNLTLATSGDLTLTAGTLDTNGKTVLLRKFSSNNSNTRTLTLGASAINLRDVASAGWDCTTSTNMTLTAGTSVITFQNTSSAVTFDGGGLTYNTLTTNTNLSTGNITITGNNSFTTLTLNMGAAGNSAGTTAINLGGNQTVSGTLTLAGNGVSSISRLFVRSTVRGTARTLSAGTVSSTNVDYQDITGAGAGSWNLSGGSAGNCGGNSGITFTTPVNRYWVPSAGTSTGSTSATTRWSATSGGAGGASAPLAQDTAYFDANSIDAGSRNITHDILRMGTFDWTGVTNTPTWVKSSVSKVFGNIIMVSGMSESGSATYTFEGRSACTIDVGGKTMQHPWTIDCVNGSLTAVSTFANTGALTMTSGSLIGGSYALTFTSCTYNGGTLSYASGATFTSFTLAAGVTHTQNGALTLSAGLTINGTFNQGAAITGGTTFTINTGGTFAMDRATSFSGAGTFAGGDVTGAYTLTVTTITFNGSAVTFNNLSGTISGTTITINGSGSTFNVKTVTGTGAITATTGTLNHSGTLTANTNCAIVPVNSIAYNPVRGGLVG